MLTFTLINNVEGKQCPRIKRPIIDSQNNTHTTINDKYILFTPRENMKKKTEILSKWLIDVKATISKAINTSEQCNYKDNQDSTPNTISHSINSTDNILIQSKTALIKRINE